MRRRRRRGFAPRSPRTRAIFRRGRTWRSCSPTRVVGPRRCRPGASSWLWTRRIHWRLGSCARSKPAPSPIDGEGTSAGAVPAPDSVGADGGRVRARGSMLAKRGVRADGVGVRAVAAVALLVVGLAACAPVLPERSKPGGAARWAQALATEAAVRWARDALLCRVTGNGVGNEGWLPDRGGSWLLTYRSAASGKALDVSVDTNGTVQTAAVPDSIAAHLKPLPAEWDDSPRIWAATAPHQQGMPLNAFEALLAYDAEPERYPGQVVWRIRFFLQGGGHETHVVSASSHWLARY